MCGIIGYIGSKQAVPLIMDGLKRLEYRGYDSAGVAVLTRSEKKDFQLQVVRAQGKLTALEERLRTQTLSGTVGMGHTRWATHGRPSDENAHPHQYGSVAVVHNGIIENYLSLRHELQAKGHVFQSETDTEIIAHLIEVALQAQPKPDLLEATRRVLLQLQGAYALVVISSRTPDEIVCAKNASPLILGVGEGESLLASDLPALLPHTRDVIILEEGDLARLTREGVHVINLQGQTQQRNVQHITWSAAMAEKEGYKHFMRKEIDEQVRAVTDTLRGRVQHEPPGILLDDTLPALASMGRICLVACGTSFHAAKIGEYWLEQLARVPAKAELASEFRYRDPLVQTGDWVIALSQSGETIDTLAALREAKQRGAYALSIVNVLGSAIARASQSTLYTHAGLEVGVASTKAFTTQLAALFLLTLRLGQQTGALSQETLKELLDALVALPHLIHETLRVAKDIQRIAKERNQARDVLFLGRGVQYPIALEGALKLKELSYIHAEGYAAGEIKHGPMALISEGLPVVVLAPKDATYEKALSNLSEVKARGAWVLAIATAGDEHIRQLADEVVYVPATSPWLYPVLTTIPLQLLAYFMADHKGNDVDQPRNLAKSVTVE